MAEATMTPPQAPAVAAAKIPPNVPVVHLTGQPNKTATPQPEEKSFFDKVDEAGVKNRKPEQKQEAKPNAEEKPPEEKVETKDKPPEQKPDEQKDKPSDTKPAEAKAAQPTAWQKAREWEKKAATLEARVKELETNPTASKPTEHPEVKQIIEEKNQLAKRVAELEDTVKYTKYEESTEYKEQYEKPFNNAYQSAVSEITGLTVTDSQGTVRQGTEADFAAILRAETTAKALSIAEELFGSPAAASLAVQYRQKVREAYSRAEEAKKEFRTKGNEREKQTSAQQAQAAEQRRQEWEKLNKDAETKFPQYFAPKDGDEKANELLRKGFEKVDAAFSGKSNPALDSEIRMKAGAFNRVAYELKSTRDELKEALAKIAEYEGSEPGKGSPEKETAPVKEKSFNDLVDEMALRGR